MPNIIVPKNEREERYYHEAARRGDYERFKGAYGEHVYIQKSKGDWSRHRREAIDQM